MGETRPKDLKFKLGYPFNFFAVVHERNVIRSKIIPIHDVYAGSTLNAKKIESILGLIKHNLLHNPKLLIIVTHYCRNLNKKRTFNHIKIQTSN